MLKEDLNFTNITTYTESLFNSTSKPNIGKPNIGGFPYLLDHLAVYIPYTVLSFFGVIFGLTGSFEFILNVHILI